MVTGEMVEELILAGADIIKVGIGPGDNISYRFKSSVINRVLSFFTHRLYVCWCMFL